MSTRSTDKEKIVWEELTKVHDPEIPVLSLVDLKVIRSVEVDDGSVRVVLTPTFAGCPALDLMKQDIRSRLLERGFHTVDVELSFAEPWSTDLLDEPAREKLREFGIAPPARVEVIVGKQEHKEVLAEVLTEPVPCPFCGSKETKLESFFGSTLCKQIFFCEHCRQSFDRFKPV